MSKFKPETVEKKSSTVGPMAGIENIVYEGFSQLSRLGLELRHIYPSEIIQNRAKCRKVIFG